MVPSWRQFDQQLAKEHHFDVVLGQETSQMVEPFDFPCSRTTSDVECFIGIDSNTKIVLSLSANEQHVEIDRTVRLTLRHGARHFRLNWLRLDKGEATSQDRIRYRGPTFLPGVVIAEDHESIVSKNPVTLLEYLS